MSEISDMSYNEDQSVFSDLLGSVGNVISSVGNAASDVANGVLFGGEDDADSQTFE